MNYAKPSLSFPDQAALLIGRGLVADPAELVDRLRMVSYYRLSAYWFPFRGTGNDLLPGTTLDMIWRPYTFDRQLRLLAMDGIERVEIAIRSQVVNLHSQKYGAFGYQNSATLPGLSLDDHKMFVRSVRNEASRSRESFVAHYKAKYTSERDLPLWIAAELLTFGGTLTLFRGLEQRLKQDLARQFGVADAVLESWLLALNHMRNICAHHGRLWNRAFGVTPKIPRARKNPQWHRPVQVTDNRCWGMLTVLRYLIGLIAPHSSWAQRFYTLADDYPDIPLGDMGFPSDWRNCPIWA